MKAKIKISTYKRLGFPTIVSVSNGLAYGNGYLEAQLWIENGQMMYNITDGFKLKGIDKPVRNNLKSAINIVAGKIMPKPWYARGV